MWRETGDYDFHPDITLSMKEKTDHKTFYDRAELIEYLKNHGVELNDPQYPLHMLGPEHNERLGYVYTVHQWSTLGWFKEV